MIQISSEFYEILERFNNNPIVQKLYNLLKDPNSVSDYDYIKLSDSNNFINFLHTKKVNDILDNSKLTVNSIKNLTHNDSNDLIFKQIGYNKNETQYWYPEPGVEGEIINEVVSEKTGKTYVLFKCLETGRLSVVNKIAICYKIPNLFDQSKNKLKIGRFITHIFENNDISFIQSEIEEFVNSYKCTIDILNDKFSSFELVSGDDIAYWYNRDRYEINDGGRLSNSCMGNSPAHFFDIYSKNKNCSLLILKSTKGQLEDGVIKSDKIAGRAIVWNATLFKNDVPEEITFMDRIYVNNDHDEAVFIEFAKQNGWWFKVSQNYYPDTTISNGERNLLFSESDCIGIEVKLDNIFFDSYPYVDTLCYLHDKNTISNSFYKNIIRDESAHSFRCTRGGYSTHAKNVDCIFPEVYLYEEECEEENINIEEVAEDVEDLWNPFSENN